MCIYISKDMCNLHILSNHEMYMIYIHCCYLCHALLEIIRQGVKYKQLYILQFEKNVARNKDKDIWRR